jgi:hypothetical protein
MLLLEFCIKNLVQCTRFQNPKIVLQDESIKQVKRDFFNHEASALLS